MTSEFDLRYGNGRGARITEHRVVKSLVGRRTMDVQFDLKQEYPVGLTRLWRALGQRDYIERKYEALGSKSLRIETVDVSPSRIEVGLERDAPIDLSSLPAWARWVGGSFRRVRQHSRWRRRTDRVVDIDLDFGVPSERVSATGAGEAVQLGPAATRLTLRFTVRCGVPVIGATVAELFARQVRHALAEDHAFTVAFLSAPDAAEGHRPRHSER